MEKLIISAVAILGTLIAIKFNGLFHKLIAIGLTISVLLVWTGNKYIITGSFIVLFVLTVATFIYGLTVKDLTKIEKISIVALGLFLTISSIFKLFHLPGSGIIKLSMIVPIFLTLATFVKGRKLTREMSFMIFWLVYATAEFLKLWIY
jgi:hypothetical protein